MKTRLLSLLFLGSLSLTGIACDGGGSGSDDETGGSAAVSACYAQCQAQEDGGCGLGLETCQELCDLILTELDADCEAKAQASYECNVANDEVCGANTECATEAEEYAACLEGA